MHRTRTVVVAAVLGLLTISAAHAAIDSTVHRTFPVREGGTLTIDSDIGDIRVRSGGSEVTIDVMRHARTSSQSRAQAIFRDLSLSFAQQGDNVTLKASYEKALRWLDLFGGDLDVHFVVTVPSRYNLNLGTAGGDIHVGDINGEVRAKTAGGDVDLARIGGPVEARTSGGDVEVADVAGPLDARTSGGNIVIRRSSDVTAHTSGGSVRIGEAHGAVNASTSGGSIEALLAQQPRKECTLRTSGGGITVAVGRSVAFDLDAHTSGGSVRTDVPVLLIGRQSESTLNGKVNGGGPRLVLRTSGGSIRIRPQ